MSVKASKPRAGKKARSVRPKAGLAPRVKKRLWIFDFDNTIARLEPEVDWPGSRRELEPMLRSVGIPGELFERHPRRNLPLYEASRALLLDGSRNGRRQSKVRGDRLTVSTVRRASLIIEKHELAGVERAAELEGAIDLIRALKRAGCMIAIVTSNSSRTVRRWLTMHRLGRSVDVIVGRDSLLGLKPSPAMVRLALRKCGATPRSAAFVGDAVSDFGAAAALGIDFYGIAAKPEAKDSLLAAGADSIFSSPAALAVHLNLPGAPQGPPARDLFDAGEGSPNAE